MELNAFGAASLKNALKALLVIDRGRTRTGSGLVENCASTETIIASMKRKGRRLCGVCTETDLRAWTISLSSSNTPGKEKVHSVGTGRGSQEYTIVLQCTICLLRQIFGELDWQAQNAPGMYQNNRSTMQGFDCSNIAFWRKELHIGGGKSPEK